MFIGDMKNICFYFGSVFCLKLSVCAILQEIPDADLNITQIFHKYGYPTEVHEIETEDGYLLTLFRIPHGRYNKEINTVSRHPVLLMHGLLGSAENWMYAGPNKSLSYLLADEGYDVWLGNSRGNMHSRKHRTLDPDKNSMYWAFSWHEIGVYDLPAIIDYILQHTQNEDLHYVGHSQGTTIFFVMGSARPEYNKKIKLMNALAPGVFMNHMKNPILKAISPYYYFLDRLVVALRAYEFIPFLPNPSLRSAGRSLCDDNSIIKNLCINLVNVVTGDDPEQLDPSILPFVLSTVPAGSSARQALHYAQSIQTGMFREYDYGSKRNMKKYKNQEPPKYNLKNVAAPVALFYSDNDEFATEIDVKRLAGFLPNLVEIYHVPLQKFTHIDFIWAKDIVPLVNERVLLLMRKYDEK